MRARHGRHHHRRVDLYLAVPADFEQSAHAKAGLSDGRTQGLPLVGVQSMRLQGFVWQEPAPGRWAWITRAVLTVVPCVLGAHAQAGRTLAGQRA